MGPTSLPDVDFRHVLHALALYTTSPHGLDPEYFSAVVRALLVRPSIGLYCTVHLLCRSRNRWSHGAKNTRKRVSDTTTKKKPTMWEIVVVQVRGCCSPLVY